MPFPWAVPGDSTLARAVRPPGHGGRPPRRQNAPRRPAAMAGEAHPVPSRTRKLSPRAPIVLRVQPVGDQDAAGRLGAFSPGGAPRRARGPSPFFEWKCGAADSSFCTNAVRSGNQSLLLGRVFKQTSRLAWCVNWVSRWRLRLCFIACFRALVHFLVIAHLHW